MGFLKIYSDEKNISAIQKKALEQAWLPCAHEQQKRAQSAGTPPRQRPAQADGIG